ncbi:hypothetical protein ACS0TY_021075 [Phlomoides rotata]
MIWLDNNGMFLVSNKSSFAFGLTTTEQDVTMFLLVVKHLRSSTIVWAANRASPVKNSDVFAFDYSGNAYLQRGGSMIWTTATANKGASSMELMESGNLVLFGNDQTIIWQSFRYPTNTLLSNQEFFEGLTLSSDPRYNTSSSLGIKSGDMILYAGFNPPQPYWSMGGERRKTIDVQGGGVVSAVLSGNSWKFYGTNKVLLWQFILSEAPDVNSTWIAALGDDGFITFAILGSENHSLKDRIPKDECSRPTACDPYAICYPGNKCQCPLAICKASILPLCSGKAPVELMSGGDGLSYSTLAFVKPFLETTTLDVCKASCVANCSCAAIFFNGNSGE